MIPSMVGDAEQRDEADGRGDAERRARHASAKIPPISAIGMTLAASSTSTQRAEVQEQQHADERDADSGTTTASRCSASCRLPNSPTHSRR